MEDEQPDTAPDDNLEMVTARLGPPEAVYQISPAYFWGKLTLAVLLVTYGIIAVLIWVFLAKAKGGHIVFHAIFWPPFLGIMLLWHMLKHRGVRILVYPTGILHLRHGMIDSYPFEEITSITLTRAMGTGVTVRHSELGLIASYFEVPAAWVQVWSGGLKVRRKDDKLLVISSVLKDFPDLAIALQNGTFPHLWPKLHQDFLAGTPVFIGSMQCDFHGLQMAKKKLAWKDVKKISVNNKIMSVEKEGGWVPWMVIPMETIPNPNLLVALANEMKFQENKTQDFEQEPETESA